jgi:hypothetical protein
MDSAAFYRANCAAHCRRWRRAEARLMGQLNVTYARIVEPFYAASVACYRFAYPNAPARLGGFLDPVEWEIMNNGTR